MIRANPNVTSPKVSSFKFRLDDSVSTTGIYAVTGTEEFNRRFEAFKFSSQTILSETSSKF